MSQSSFKGICAASLTAFLPPGRKVKRNADEDGEHEDKSPAVGEVAHCGIGFHLCASYR
jgi:hypothetical protein